MPQPSMRGKCRSPRHTYSERQGSAWHRYEVLKSLQTDLHDAFLWQTAAFKPRSHRIHVDRIHVWCRLCVGLYQSTVCRPIHVDTLCSHWIHVDQRYMYTELTVYMYREWQTGKNSLHVDRVEHISTQSTTCTCQWTQSDTSCTVPILHVDRLRSHRIHVDRYNLYCLVSVYVYLVWMGLYRLFQLGSRLPMRWMTHW